MWEATGDAALLRLAEGRSPRAEIELRAERDYPDWLSTSLMDCYKNTAEPAVFALLFELNRADFLQAIQAKLRRSHHHVDAHDVLQEVFLNIYRYPHHFHADRPDAFRGWGHRIARNAKGPDYRFVPIARGTHYHLRAGDPAKYGREIDSFLDRMVP